MINSYVLAIPFYCMVLLRAGSCMWRGSGGICMPFVVGKDCKGGWNLVRPDGLFSSIAQVSTISQCEGRCDFYVCALSC